MNKKAIALISGGLDSLLAAKFVEEQGIEIFGVCFVIPFASRDIRGFKRNVREAASGAGISVRFEDLSEDFLEVLRAPRYGYGANLNPCVDCKILMLSAAKRLMKRVNAGFVVTGEVLGERPMSQRRDALNTIRNRSGLGGRLLRPLSAKRLEETEPEKNGTIDRNKLLDITGRSRKTQFALAERYGIRKFFAPAGGCLLTDPVFAGKLKDLIDEGDLTLRGVELLKYGRHFCLDGKIRIIVGRNEEENRSILALKTKKDIILRLKEDAGPYVLLRGSAAAGSIKKAAALAISHSKKKDGKEGTVEFWDDEKHKKVIKTGPMTREKIETLRV